MQYTLQNVDKGVFHLHIPSLVLFISSFIDGIVQNVATCAAANQNYDADIPMMFQLLAKAVLGFLEV